MGWVKAGLQVKALRAAEERPAGPGAGGDVSWQHYTRGQSRYTLNPAPHSPASPSSAQATPAQAGMVLKSRIVTHPHARSSIHMTLCQPIYMLAPKSALALAIASMLPNSKSSCLCPMGKVLLGEKTRRAATRRDLPGTCLSPGTIILSCFLPGKKVLAVDNPHPSVVPGNA